MIRHIVALRFKSGISAADKDAIYVDLQRLSGHIEGILGFHAGPNVSVELPVVRGFNDVFWFDFRDVAVRDVYLADPVHQAIGGRIVAATEGGIDGVFVFDVAV